MLLRLNEGDVDQVMAEGTLAARWVEPIFLTICES
jgi:hypothetical protein